MKKDKRENSPRVARGKPYSYWKRLHIKEKLQKRARDFWQEKLAAINAFGTMDSPTLEDYSYQSFVDKVKKGEITRRDQHITYFSPSFGIFVKPSLPWKKIDKCLNDIQISNEMKDLIIFILKPFPLEKDLKGIAESESVKELEVKICGDYNNLIKKLSPLSKQLQNITKEEPFLDSPALIKTIEKIEYEVSVAKEIVKYGTGIHREVYKRIGLDKDLRVSPQKHEFWNLATSGAVAVLNEFYHSDTCRDGRDCSKTHEEAIRKTAELLKILYPTIWKESVPLMARRIKQKNYRSLPC